MSAAAPAYRKLPGGGLTWKGRGQLWVGEDHLLEVSSFLMIEHYRRFFFYDVKAFIVQRTKLQLAWNWVHGGIGLVCVLMAAGSWGIGAEYADEDWHVGMYVLAVMFGVAAVILLTLFLVNWLLGPSCRCYLLTSTGWHALAAPARLGPAGRMQAQIIPLIEAAQVGLSTAESGAS